MKHNFGVFNPDLLDIAKCEVDVDTTDNYIDQVDNTAEHNDHWL